MIQLRGNFELLPCCQRGGYGPWVMASRMEATVASSTEELGEHIFLCCYELNIVDEVMLFRRYKA